jgi:hypothetical protein
MAVGPRKESPMSTEHDEATACPKTGKEIPVGEEEVPVSVFFRVLVIAFFVALFFAYTTPACDTDCWWHLATGRWIVENRSLPHVDPFDFTSATFGASGQVRYQLTQYWLAQTSLYLSFLAAGLKGVVLLRGAVFTALFACLYRLLRRSGAGVLLSALLVASASRPSSLKSGTSTPDPRCGPASSSSRCCSCSSNCEVERSGRASFFPRSCSSGPISTAGTSSGSS